ncbi:MAG: SAM-dependent methyltransferase [Cohnella sp.]|nr:SAM-dependent methyltransferase [Cohnella sp.]
MDANHSTTPLAAMIRAEIAELSAISFHHYMSLCLYHPDYGYYRSGKTRVGRAGDFYTSAYVGEIMGEQLAASIIRLTNERFSGSETVEVVDWGGGTGRLSRAMLDAWASSGEAGRRFSLTVIEGNPEHRKEAGEQLSPYMDAGIARVIDGLPEQLPDWSDRPVVVVANELLDAFPVHRIVKRDGRIFEWGVTWDERSESFAACLLPRSETNWSAWLEDQGVTLSEGQTFEVNPDAAGWIQSLARRVGQALLVLVDYGDEDRELSAPHRMDGTLLCYARHRAHNDPYRIPGEQDLTAHVNFSHMRRAAEQAGWRQIWYGTQKRFLVESGVMDKLSEHRIADPFHPIARRNRAIRQLLLSDNMSELFKVQIFERP